MMSEKFLFVPGMGFESMACMVMIKTVQNIIRRLPPAFAVLLSNIYTPAYAQQACWNPDLLQRSDVPICENVGSVIFPDAAKPTAAVFLSYIVSRNDETIVKAYAEIKKFSPDTKLNILISKNAMNLFNKYAAYCSTTATESYKYLCELRNVFADTKSVNVIQLSKDQDQVYPQDYLQFGIKSNAPILFPTLNPWETMDYVDANKNPLPKTFIQDDIARSCSIESQTLEVSRLKGHSSMMGGNLESLPGGTSILGKSVNSDFSALDNMKDDELYSQLRSNYPESVSNSQIRSSIIDMRDMVATKKAQLTLMSNELKDVIEIDTSLAPVGHADEMFSVVKSNSSCGYSILIPSPSLAIDLMKNAKLVENKESCISSDSNARPGFDGSSLDKLDRHSKSGCVGFRGLTFTDFLNRSEILKMNQQFEQISLNNVTTIKKHLASRGCQSVDILEMPYLISSSSQAASEGVIPNPVNALIISPISGSPSIYLNNPTYVSIFDSYISSKLKSRGIRVSLTNSSDYFGGQGGLHCGSSTIQLCRMK